MAKTVISGGVTKEYRNRPLIIKLQLKQAVVVVPKTSQV